MCLPLKPLHCRPTKTARRSAQQQCNHTLGDSSGVACMHNLDRAEL